MENQYTKGSGNMSTGKKSDINAQGVNIGSKRTQSSNSQQKDEKRQRKG